MEIRKRNFLVFMIAAALACVSCECDENGVWMRQYSFGSAKNFTIKWNFTDDSIQMVMIGNTKGWVAVGFGQTKSLNGTDIVIGWVDDNTQKTYLQDRHGDEKNQSLLDDKNSYSLLNGKQNESSTIICWIRKLETCDEQDYQISFSTVRVFWATGEKDPPEENFNVPESLGSTKGIKSLRFLNLKYPRPDTSDIKTIDFVAQNITIKKDKTGTVYWCSHFTIPKSDRNSHLIGFEPVIQNGNIDIFHHFLLYECPTSIIKNFGWNIPEKGYSCFDIPRFEFQDACIIHLNSWAVGGEAEFYPPDVGYPFHRTDKDKYFMLQSHYNVQNLKSERRDSSGIKLFYTYTLRSNEAAHLITGANVSPFQLIPPNQKSFTNTGICSEECTKSTIPESGVRIVTIMFHSHIMGRKIRLRRFRNGKELEPIADESFDFDFQETANLNKTFDIMPGDKLLGECVYDTTARNYTTVGGFGTPEEMCLIFMFYVKSANLTVCGSYLNPEEVFNLTYIKAVLPVPKFCWGPDCEYVYAGQGVVNLVGAIMLPLKNFGKKLVDYFRDYNWTEAEVKTLQELYYKNQISLCKNDEIAFNSKKTDVSVYPVDFVPYKKPDFCTTDTS